MLRPSHSKKEVEEALRHAEAQGWRVEVGGSHAWGGFIALTRMTNPGAVNSALPACGVRRRTLAVMLALCGPGGL